MKKGLIMFLTVICITVPAFSNNIDAFIKQDSKLLVMDKLIDAFNTNVFIRLNVNNILNFLFILLLPLEILKVFLSPKGKF